MKHSRRKFLAYNSAAIATSVLLKACGRNPTPNPNSEAGTVSTAPSPTTAKTFKVAIALPGTITDKGWNQAGYEAISKAKLKPGVETAYVEKVAQPDFTETLSDFARRGYNLVFAHGGQFQAAVKQVSTQFPKTFFIVSDGVITGSNIASLQVDHLQIAYLCGIVASLMSKSSSIALLTAQSFTTTDQEFRGFELGAKSVKPSVKVNASYTGDWNDIVKAKEATLALVASGVDVVYSMLDAAAPGVLQTLSDKGAYAIGYFEDQLNLAPKTVLTSAVQNYASAIDYIAEVAMKGEIKGEVYKVGLDKPNILRLGAFGAMVPEAVKQKALRGKDAILTKKITFEDCKIGGKDSWCVKQTTSA